jgi:hypothetical protein
MYREEAAVAALEATADEALSEDLPAASVEHLDVSRRLLRAVETYKAGCAVAGEQPTEEDSWLVLLAALQHEPGDAAA